MSDYKTDVMPDARRKEAGAIATSQQMMSLTWLYFVFQLLLYFAFPLLKAQGLFFEAMPLRHAHVLMPSFLRAALNLFEWLILMHVTDLQAPAT